MFESYPPNKAEDHKSSVTPDPAASTGVNDQACTGESSQDHVQTPSSQMDDAQTRMTNNAEPAAVNQTTQQCLMPAKQPQAIPCPADGDIIVFCHDVAQYVQQSQFKPQTECNNDSSYAVLEIGGDALAFVLQQPDMTSQDNPVCLKLVMTRSGFDSTFMWHATDDNDNPWLICIHFPVSGRTPIPENCQHHIRKADFDAMLSDTRIQAYALKNIITLRSWREATGTPSPDVIFLLLEKLADALTEIYQTGHTLMRISPDNTILDNDHVQFMGIASFDLPWNERCAVAHRQVDFAAIPPECFGFLRQHLKPVQMTYSLGALADYLVAGVKVPTCELLAYEAALLPRAFNPLFPIGWDEIILKAIKPNPELRYQNVAEFMAEMQEMLDKIQERRGPQPELVFDMAVDTHIGINKRLRCPINQDAILLKHSEDKKRILMVVADGVSTSTYGSGDIASHIITDTASRLWDDEIANAETINPRQIVTQILVQSNETICQYIRDRFADKNPMSSECMGSTALVAIIEDGIMTLASIGDSRAYVVRRNSMSCITRDHNLFTVGIINGLPVEMCAGHPHAGSLVQCLGYYNEEEEDDVLSFDIYQLKLMPGDTIMLTTDGILDYIACDITASELAIHEILRQNMSAALSCLELIMQANVGGGGDNCGVGIIRVMTPAKEQDETQA